MVISGNQQLLHALNRLAVLRTIRWHPGISRVQLADHLGLTRPTIGNLIDELICERWLKEVRQGPTGSLGRRPVSLHIDTDGRTIIGIEISAEVVSCVASSLDGKIREISSFSPQKDLEDMADMLAGHISTLWHKTDNKISVLGIGLPDGYSETTEDGMSFIASFRSPREIHDALNKNLQEKGLGNIPTIILEAADCRASYHFEYGLTEDQGPLLYLYAGNTVSAAIAAEYTLLRGHHRRMGNIGNFILAHKDSSLSCGHPTYAKDVTTLNAIQKMSGIRTENLSEAISQARPEALDALHRAGTNFGQLAYNLYAQFDPYRIFVDGPVFDSDDHYLNAARQSFASLIRQTSPALESVRHEENTVALGAAIAALHALMHQI